MATPLQLRAAGIDDAHLDGASDPRVPSPDPQRLRSRALEVLRIESEAVADTASAIDEGFVEACGLILRCRGRLVVAGMGKSGHVARKLAATFASTGTPAFFLHPAEASHGDMGMVTPADVFLCLSNSGTTEELLSIVPLVKRIGAPLIAITGNPSSRLATLADAHLTVRVAREACPMNLAPTASTTAAMALGDALAVAVLDAREFSAEDFARSHPGGALGRRLLTRVHDLMHTGERIPAVRPNAPLVEAIVEITRKRLGMTAIVDDAGRVQGILTDGDLRRLLERGSDVRALGVSEVMSPNPRCVPADALAAEALRIMEEARVGQLLAVDDRGILVGALNFQDLLVAKIV